MAEEEKEEICNLCGVKYQTSSLQHKITNNHQTQLKLALENVSEIEQEKCIVIQVIHSSNRLQIANKFSEYGSIVDIYFHPQMRYINVQMESKQLAEETLEKIKIKGHCARLRNEISQEEWEILNLELPRGLELNNSFIREHVNLFNQLTNPSIDAQIEEFFRQITLKKQDIEKRNLIISELTKVLHFGKICPFGSYLTGMCDKNSDIDISFEDCGTSKHDKRRVIKGVVVALNRARRPNDLKFAQVIKYLPFIRVPLIRFIHLETQVHCDISFENMAVQNSQLIRFLLGFDPIVRPLMALIRYWCRFHNLIHDGGLKNYAVSLLVIVCLVRKGILPSVELLQSLTPPNMVDDHWNTAFCEDVQLIKQTMGVQEKPKTYVKPSDVLLFALEFFDMITNIRKDDVIVCSIDGEFIKKENFIPGNEDSLPQSQSLYKSWAKFQSINSRINLKSPLCVQDPFDLKHNTTFMANENCINRFVQAAEETAKFLRQGIQNHFIYFFTPVKQEKKWKNCVTNNNNNDNESPIINPQTNDNNMNKQEEKSVLSSSAIVWTIDDKFKEIFLSNVKGLAPLEDLLKSMNTLWLNNVHSFFETVFKKVFDFDVRRCIKLTRHDKMSIVSNSKGLVQIELQPSLDDIMKNESNIIDDNNAHYGKNSPYFNAKQKKKNKRKKGKKSKNIFGTTESSNDPNLIITAQSTKSHHPSTNLPLKDDATKKSPTSSICTGLKRQLNASEVNDADNDNKIDQEVDGSQRKFIKSEQQQHPYRISKEVSPKLTDSQINSIDFTSDSFTDAMKFNENTDVLSTSRCMEKNNPVLPMVIDEKLPETSLIDSSLLQSKLKVEYENDDNVIVDSEDKKVKTMEIGEENNPLRHKYRDLSSQTQQEHIIGYEARGFFKFWEGREKILEEVMNSEEPQTLQGNDNENPSNNQNFNRKHGNPMEIEREISSRIWKNYISETQDSTIKKKIVFDFCCIAKLELKHSDNRPEVSVQFSEILKSYDALEVLPFSDYIDYLQKVLEKSFMDFIHFKLHSWLNVPEQNENRFKKGTQWRNKMDKIK